MPSGAVQSDHSTLAPEVLEVLATRSRRTRKWLRWEREVFKIGKCLWIGCNASTKMKCNQVFKFILKNAICACICVCVCIGKFDLLFTSGNSITRKVNFHGNIENQQDDFGVCNHFSWACYQNIYFWSWFTLYSVPLTRCYYSFLPMFIWNPVFILCTSMLQQVLFTHKNCRLTKANP